MQRNAAYDGDDAFTKRFLYRMVFLPLPPPRSIEAHRRLRHRKSRALMMRCRLLGSGRLATIDDDAAGHDFDDDSCRPIGATTLHSYLLAICVCYFSIDRGALPIVDATHSSLPPRPARPPARYA